MYFFPFFPQVFLIAATPNFFVWLRHWLSVSVSVLHRYCLLNFAETHLFNCILLFTYFVLLQDRFYLLLEMKMYVTTILFKFVAQMFQIYLSVSLFHELLLMFNVLFHSLEENAGALTNFEVLDFLRAKGASKDPSRVLAKVAMSEYKVCYSDETTNLSSIRDFSFWPIDGNNFCVLLVDYCVASFTGLRLLG